MQLHRSGTLFHETHKFPACEGIFSPRGILKIDVSPLLGHPPLNLCSSNSRSFIRHVIPIAWQRVP